MNTTCERLDARLAFSRLADVVLETSVVGSFSKVGYVVRDALGAWQSIGGLSGRHVVITGSTSGIGLEAARTFCRLGASVRFIARNLEKAQATKAMLEADQPDATVDYLIADVASLSSLVAAGRSILEEGRAIDVLVHNAGALSAAYSTAPTGLETTVACHLVGPFLLTTLLRPLLERAQPGRVIAVSSGGMYTQRFDLDALVMEPGDYDGVVAYARAKRAQLVVAHEWAHRVDPNRVVFHAMHPGWVDTPGIASALPHFAGALGRLLRTPAQGADTIVWLAASEEAASVSGRFWLDRRVRSEYKLPWTRPCDPLADQRALWEWCADKIRNQL